MAEEWYWCLSHSSVESGAGCRAGDRLGPYPTREAAAGALETVRQRNEAADREDEDG